MAHICDSRTGKSEAGELPASAGYIVSSRPVKTIETDSVFLLSLTNRNSPTTQITVIPQTQQTLACKHYNLYPRPCNDLQGLEAPSASLVSGGKNRAKPPSNIKGIWSGVPEK